MIVGVGLLGAAVAARSVDAVRIALIVSLFMGVWLVVVNNVFGGRAVLLGTALFTNLVIFFFFFFFFGLEMIFFLCVFWGGGGGFGGVGGCGGGGVWWGVMGVCSGWNGG